MAESWDPEISAIGVLEMLDDTYHGIEVHRMMELQKKELVMKRCIDIMYRNFSTQLSRKVKKKYSVLHASEIQYGQTS